MSASFMELTVVDRFEPGTVTHPGNGATPQEPPGVALDCGAAMRPNPRGAGRDVPHYELKLRTSHGESRNGLLTCGKVVRKT